jgi:translocation and assembly module TamA
LFVDTGGVSDRLGNLRLSTGVGAGVRWKSPVGPLQADLAYGIKTRKPRLHMSVGFVF